MCEQIDYPVSVIAVVGLYRTGKSFLMNRILLEQPDGFAVGPTVNPCTKGLWLWNKVEILSLLECARACTPFVRFAHALACPTFINMCNAQRRS